MNQLAQDLTAARAVIQDPAKWTHNVLARDANGSNKPPTHPLTSNIFWYGLEGNDPMACQWCALGAVQHVAGPDTLRFTSAKRALCVASRELYGEYCIATINDNTDHAAVLACFDRAIEAAK